MAAVFPRPPALDFLMSRILALDTSTDALSVALGIDGQLMESHRVIPRQHGQEILPTVDQLLSQAGIRLQQLDAIAFGCGPGSFTGLRIALGIVQGLAFGADLPVIPVSTLATLACTGWATASRAPCAVLASLDARMGQVYWAIYQVDAESLETIHPDSLSAPTEVFLPAPCSTPVIGVGSGCLYLTDVPGLSIEDQTLTPRASAMLGLAAKELAQGRTVAAEHTELVYLRDQVAWQRS
jgi:tRNA threonylcarbamoyladenosine biosynthesis protein TsaB